LAPLLKVLLDGLADAEILDQRRGEQIDMAFQ